MSARMYVGAGSAVRSAETSIGRELELLMVEMVVYSTYIDRRVRLDQLRPAHLALTGGRSVPVSTSDSLLAFVFLFGRFLYRQGKRKGVSYWLASKSVLACSCRQREISQLFHDDLQDTRENCIMLRDPFMLSSVELVEQILATVEKSYLIPCLLLLLLYAKSNGHRQQIWIQ